MRLNTNYPPDNAASTIVSHTAAAYLAEPTNRMKAATRLTNESGKWELTKRRRLI